MFDLDSALGIEVRDRDLVFATISRGLGGYTLRNAQVVENFRSLESSELHSQVQQYLRTNGFNRENVILGLPRDGAIVRSVELPLEVEENLDQVVQFQTAKLEPLDEEGSYYDYVVLERNEKEKTILLQIVMVPREMVDWLLHLFRELNLYPAAIRLSSLGLHHLLLVHKDSFGSLPSILICAEDSSLEVVVSNGINQCFAHTTAIDPETFTLDVLLEELDLFVTRLHLAKKEFRKIYLCGSRTDELLEPITECFGDCEALSRGLKFKKVNGTLPSDAYHAAGLAVSGVNKSKYSRFNLIPASKRLMGQRPSLVPTLGLAALFVIMLVLMGTRGFFQQKQIVAALAAEVNQIRPSVEEALAVSETLDEKAETARQLNEILSGRQKVLSVLRELTEKIPPDTYLQNISIQRDKVTITGYSEGSTTSLQGLLSSSPLFASVENRYTTTQRDSNTEKFNFDLLLREEFKTP